MQATNVTAPDGLSLAVQEWGNPRGPEILLIHGFSQSLLSWQQQVEDPALAAEFRMVAVDLRGHGSSDKPLEKDRYAHARWGDDVVAVIKATGLRRPVLAGWSYGSNVICDYVRSFGTDGIAGINFVAGATKTDRSFYGSGRRTVPNMHSEDLATNIAATRAFLRACFERQPTEDAFETMLAFNMVVPARVRAAINDRPTNTGDALTQIRCPALVTHGTKDQILLATLGKFTAATVPGAKLSLYDGVGHAPFWEDAPRFNQELAAFVRTANSIKQ